jgi:DNA repair exonuclease SbcCD nuclease subunit
LPVRPLIARPHAKINGIAKARPRHRPQNPFNCKGKPEDAVAVKILHTADLHLDSPLASLALRDPDLQARVATASRRALERMVDVCIAEDVAALLIAGDLYDRAERSAKTAAYLAVQIERLRAAGVRVFYIKGNHDAENPITGEIALPANVHVFDGRGGKVQLAPDIWVHGISFHARHAPESLVRKFGTPVAGAVNIAMLHTSLTGAAGHDPYAPCSVNDLVQTGFDYWALGHIHKRQVHATAPFVVMPGNPQGRDIGEAGPKTATLLTIDAGQITLSERATSSVEFRETALSLTGLADDDAIRDALRAHLADQAAAVPEAAILRLTLTGTTPRAWSMRRDRDVWTEQLHSMAADTGRLWIEKISFHLTAPAATPNPGDAVAEVQRLMADIAQEAGFQDEARREVEQMLALLPPARRAALYPDAAALAALVDRLSQDAVLAMTAAMRGTEAGSAP